MTKQIQPQHTAQQHRAAREQYWATPEGQAAHATAAAALAKAQEEDAQLMQLHADMDAAAIRGDWQEHDRLSALNERLYKDRRNWFEAKRKAGQLTVGKMQAEAEAETQRQRADRAEAGQTPRRVPFDETDLATKPNGHEFTPRDFCEALKREEEHATAIRRALTSWNKRTGKGTKRGTRWALTRAEAELFWLWHDTARHEKPHPPRAKNKIARQ